MLRFWGPAAAKRGTILWKKDFKIYLKHILNIKTCLSLHPEIDADSNNIDWQLCLDTLHKKVDILSSVYDYLKTSCTYFIITFDFYHVFHISTSFVALTIFYNTFYTYFVLFKIKILSACHFCSSFLSFYTIIFLFYFAKVICRHKLSLY